MRIVSSLLLLAALSFASAAFANQDRAMYVAYQKINYSLRGGNLRFSCEQGLTQFRLRSDFGTRARLYWQSAEGWVELEDVIYGDNYLSFDGMGREGGVAVSDLELNVGLPIFNNKNSKTVNDYFHKAQRAPFTDYVYIIDMLNQTMRASNVEPIVDYLVLDKDTYLREQAYQTTGREVASIKAEQQRALQQAIERYADGIKIVTTAGKHQLQSRCYLE